MMFTLIVVMLALVVMMVYARESRILCRKVEHLYTDNLFGIEIDREAALSRLRKRVALAYLTVMLFHSALYTSLHLL